MKTMRTFLIAFLAILTFGVSSFAEGPEPVQDSNGTKKTIKRIVVDLNRQKLYAYEDNRLFMSSRISSGKVGHETPSGKFKILEKQKVHISNLYPPPNGGAEMPYMLRIGWDGVAIHLGYVPNYPASHGCIRVPNGNAQRLYRWADVGTPVIVEGKAPVRNDIGKSYFAGREDRQDDVIVAEDDGDEAYEIGAYGGEGAGEGDTYLDNGPSVIY
jgi:hypothetical protein